jgi:hypothetical protein
MPSKVLGAAFIAILAGTLGGQTPAGVVSRAFDSAVGTSRSWSIPPSTQSIPRGVSSRFRSLAPLASAIVPGTGQLLLSDDRFMAYAAVEALSWWNFAKANRDQYNQEANSKTLARRVARAHFTTGSPDALPDASWAYYEKMRDHLESGQYSLAVSGDVVPETDVTTFNGYLWQLALSTNSTRAGALAQYKSQAIKPEFEWSWFNAGLQYDLFARTTFKRNDAANTGTRALLIIGANHVLSMVDAFTTLRLRARREADGRTSLGASLQW